MPSSYEPQGPLFRRERRERHQGSVSPYRMPGMRGGFAIDADLVGFRRVRNAILPSSDLSEKA
jgi:hypothetical protein